MRVKRALLLAPDHKQRGGVYHCVSRVVWREFIFGSEEKEYFRKIMRKYEQYCGVQVLSYCLMSNHFHILVKIPPRPTRVMEDEEFLQKLSLIYSKMQVRDVFNQIEMIRNSQGEGDVEYLVDALKEKYTRRMWDLSEFMKAIKQKFTLWYNKRTGKRGTLWEGRFKSVLVQEGTPTRMTAAYIDLNPVRAGMVKDAKDYRWCSYGEAIAGTVGTSSNLSSKMSQQGLLEVLKRKGSGVGETVDDTATWESVMAEYRVLLACEGQAVEQDCVIMPGDSAEQIKKKARGYSKAEVEKIIADGGKLSWKELLRCRTRYFTDGTVIGSREFVDTFFVRLKENNSQLKKRTSGARRMKYLKDEMYVLRDLVQQVVGP